LEAGLSGSIKKSNLIHSDFYTSGPPTLSIFFTLEDKGMGEFSRTKEDKAAEDLGNLLMAIVQIDLAQQIIIYGCHLF
jgi:hypothetical protein